MRAPPSTGHVPTVASAPDCFHALQSLRMPGGGRPTATARRGSTSTNALTGGGDQVGLNLLDGLAARATPQHGVEHAVGGVDAGKAAGVDQPAASDVVLGHSLPRRLHYRSIALVLCEQCTPRGGMDHPDRTSRTQQPDPLRWYAGLPAW